MLRRPLMIFAGMIVFSTSATISMAAERNDIRAPLASESTTSGMGGSAGRTTGNAATAGVMGSRATEATPLTNAECTALGGSLVHFPICNSRQVCITVDQNQKQHLVCISVSK